MADRDWLNPPEEPIYIKDIFDIFDYSWSSSPKQRLKEDLLSVADFANTLAPDESMAIQRHDQNKEKDGRMFTIRTYTATEDKLYE